MKLIAVVVLLLGVWLAFGLLKVPVNNEPVPSHACAYGEYSAPVDGVQYKACVTCGLAQGRKVRGDY
jgi:hypothetical protein